MGLLQNAPPSPYLSVYTPKGLSTLLSPLMPCRILVGSYVNEIYTVSVDPETSSVSLVSSTAVGYHPHGSHVIRLTNSVGVCVRDSSKRIERS